MTPEQGTSNPDATRSVLQERMRAFVPIQEAHVVAGDKISEILARFTEMSDFLNLEPDAFEELMGRVEEALSSIKGTTVNYNTVNETTDRIREAYRSKLKGTENPPDAEKAQ